MRTDESGWSWFIPLHDGSTSVGIVMNQDISNRKKKEVQSVPGVSSLQAHYLEEVQKVPGLIKLLGEATLKNSGQPGAVKSTSDFSYSASSYAGDHYRIVGDAGGKSRAFSEARKTSPQPNAFHSFHRSVLFVGRPPCIHRRSVCSSNNLGFYPWCSHRG